MPFLEIQLLMPREQLDAWSDALIAAGALSVAIEDEDRDTDREVAMFGEPGAQAADPGWRNNRLSILIDESADATAVLDSASRSLGQRPPAILRRKRLEDRDWVRQTQSQFTPIRVGRIWIVPSWHDPPDPAACNVRIDPGVAFGTGSHPTTRLCLAWLDQHLAPGASLLDYGCGSGILSICAARLGAREVVGVDIDPQALRTAQFNAERNGVRAQYTSTVGLPADGSRRFDVVIANILANPIVLLAPSLVRYLQPRSSIVLSGILQRQVDTVLQAYAQADPDLRLSTFGEQEGWGAIVGERGDR
jgi:ribosomal protein L11 methyltransferase